MGPCLLRQDAAARRSGKTQRSAAADAVRAVSLGPGAVRAVTESLISLSRSVCRASLTFEEELAFVECYSAFVFRSNGKTKSVLPAPIMVDVWEALVDLVVWYIRPPCPDAIEPDAQPKGTPAGAAHGQRLALNYAEELMEERGFPNQMFTFNLHQVCCRLPMQELNRVSERARRQSEAAACHNNT